MMAKLLGWYARAARVRASCFHWQTWDEVGMVTVSENLSINKKRARYASHSSAEGSEHLVRSCVPDCPKRGASERRALRAPVLRAAAVGRRVAEAGRLFVRAKRGGSGVVTLTLNVPRRTML